MPAHAAAGCPGPMYRRDFLRAGLLSLGGLSLADLLRARAQAAKRAEDTACIFVWLQGGPSHLETYDLKPDAPAEYRGIFSPIHTRVPGLDICELLPRHAQVADRFTLIRSVTHRFSGHIAGSQMVLTGRPPVVLEKHASDYPDVGSIFKRERPAREAVPSYVAVKQRVPYAGPAYLGRAYEPFVVGASNAPQDDPSRPEFQVRNLALSDQLSLARLNDRKRLLHDFDGLRREIDSSGATHAKDTFYQEAMELLTSDKTRLAFDLTREPPAVRDRYGRTEFGQCLLLCRRLVEAGVGFVSFDNAGLKYENGNGRGGRVVWNWDGHAVNWHIFEEMQKRLPIYDQALTALIEDLYDRGLDRRVLLVVTGEIGRTPIIKPGVGVLSKVLQPGREHWGHAMSMLVSGGGMKMGQVIGSTTSKGERPRDRPLKPEDLLATVYSFLGIDWQQEYRDHTGRPLAILPDGEPIAELVS